MLVLYLLSHESFYSSQFHLLWKPLCPAAKQRTLAKVKQANADAESHKDIPSFSPEAALFFIASLPFVFTTNHSIFFANPQVPL